MSETPDDLDPEEERVREEQAKALVQAYTEKFGSAPESVKHAVDALAAGELDNLPLTSDGKIDVVAWNERIERSE
jgi:hypothetical protein